MHPRILVDLHFPGMFPDGTPGRGPMKRPLHTALLDTYAFYGKMQTESWAPRKLGAEVSIHVRGIA